MINLSQRLRQHDSPLLVIGDKKGPGSYDLAGCEFYSLQAQQQLPLSLARKLPTGHYARKNIGYLLAIRQGADCLYETDDDNEPKANWEPRRLETEARLVSDRQWCNVYRFYSEKLIWPRGLPLDMITDETANQTDIDSSVHKVESAIQQGLVNVSPDVDSLWRLIIGGDFDFEPGASLYLKPGTWSPFNSQSTWWWPSAYPLLYLPSFCSFRMTDIWRGFIAQRCLWELDQGIVYHGPEVDQERNPHRLMRDFEQEIPGYLGNQDLIERLENLSLKPGLENVSANLYRCYEALIEGEYFPAKELDLVTAWIDDISQAGLRVAA